MLGNKHLALLRRTLVLLEERQRGKSHQAKSSRSNLLLLIVYACSERISVRRKDA